MQLSQYSKS